MLITPGTELKAIDLLTHDTTVFISQGSHAIAIDPVDMKIYFDNGGISRANLDGTDVKVISKNARVYNMAIDWIGRRVLWTEVDKGNWIFVMNFNGKERRSLIKTQDFPVDVTVDPTVG